jgi:hypothetical protein
MGTVTKPALIGLLVILLVCLAVPVVLVVKRGYSLEEMDWNGDGTTTVSEILESIDIETRRVQIDGKQCVEYYRLKDALPVKTKCNENDSGQATN